LAATTLSNAVRAVMEGQGQVAEVYEMFTAKMSILKGFEPMGSAIGAVRSHQGARHERDVRL